MSSNASEGTLSGATGVEASDAQASVVYTSDTSEPVQGSSAGPGASTTLELPTLNLPSSDTSDAGSPHDELDAASDGGPSDAEAALDAEVEASLDAAIDGQAEASDSSAPDSASPTPCEVGSFDVDEGPGISCVPWTPCGPGSFVVVAGSDATDQSCEVCAAGQFSEVTNATACTPCEEGTFSMFSGSTQCLPWTDCGWAAEQSAGSSVADRVCETGHVYRQFGGTSWDNVLAMVLGTNDQPLLVASQAATFPTTDTFLERFDETGNSSVVAQVASGRSATGLALDPSGNSFIVGSTFEEMEGANYANQNAFVTALDVTGTELWTEIFGTPNDYDQGKAIAVHSTGSLVVGGMTLGDFGGPNQIYYDAYVHWLDSSGSGFQTVQFGTNGEDWTHDLAIDAEGNVIVVGSTTVTSPQTNQAFGDAWVRKLDPSGAVLWSEEFGTTGHDEALGVAVDSNGNVIVVGYLNGADQNGGPSSTDAYESAFVYAFDSTGNALWTHTFGATDGADRALDVAIDSGDEIVVVGYTTGSLASANAGGSTPVDAFVRKVSAAGSELWTVQIGAANQDEFVRVVVDSHDHVFAAGTTQGTFGRVPSGPNDALVVQIQPPQ